MRSEKNSHDGGLGGSSADSSAAGGVPNRYPDQNHTVEEARYDVTEFLAILRQYKLYMLLLIAIGGATAYWITRYTVFPVHTSTVTILDKTAAQSRAALTFAPQEKWTAGTLESILREKVAEEVEEAFLANYPKMPKTMRDELYINYDVTSKDNTIKLSVASKSGIYLSELAYMLAKSLVSADSELVRKQTSDFKQYLEETKDKEMEELRRTETAVVTYLTEDEDILKNLSPEGIRDWGRFKSNLVGKLTRFEGQLERARLDYRDAVGKLENVRKTLEEQPDYIRREQPDGGKAEENVPEVEPPVSFEDYEFEGMDAIEPVSEKLTELELELLTLLVYQTEKSPEVLRLQDVINTFRELERKMLEEYAGNKKEAYELYLEEYAAAHPEKAEDEAGEDSGLTVTNIINQIKETARRDLIYASYEVDKLKARIANLEEEIKPLRNKSDALPGVESEYKRLVLERDSINLNYQATLGKLREVAFQENRRDQTYEILIDHDALAKELASAKPEQEYAAYQKVIATYKTKPPFARNVILGIIFGALFCFGTVYYIEISEKRIRKPEEIKRVLGLKPLGIITRRKKDFLILDSERKPTPFAEAYYVLNNTIQYAFPTNRKQSIMVTSSFKGEGKTLTAVNMAIAAALEGRKTVLVDADLRSHSTQEHLSGLIDNDIPEKGLAHYVRNGYSPKEIVIPTAINELYWIPPGDNLENPPKYFGNNRFGELFDYLRGEFDVIVMDVPPILPVVDATILASHADGVLMLVAYKTVQKRFAAEALNRLLHVKAPVMGAIITKTPTSAPFVPSYGYTYYHKLYR